MAKITFQYRGTKETGNLTIRLIHGKEIDVRTSSSIQSKKEYWFKRTTPKGGKTKIRHIQPEEISNIIEGAVKHKQKLIKIKNNIISKFISDHNKGKPIEVKWLKKTVLEFSATLDTKEKIQEVVSIKEDKAEKKRAKKERIENANLLPSAIKKMFIKYATNKLELAKYKVTLSLLLEFQEYKKQTFKIVDLNQDFANMFKNWAFSEMKYKKSYVNAQLKKLRSSAVNAFENDEEEIIRISKTLRSFKMFKDIYKGKIVNTLNYDELDLIDKKIIKDVKLQDVKKAILIGCETGLRYSDMNKLIDENIKKVDGIGYWKFRTEKTDAIVQITITKRIIYLIDKYGLPKTNYPANGVKLNIDIKEVCKLSEIDKNTKGSKPIVLEVNNKNVIRNVVDLYPKYELMTSRTFRRSFATNYYGKIDTSLIIVITGHATEKQLRAYINNNDETNIKRTKEQIDHFHEERKNELILKAKLKVV
jgi:integrase